MMKTEILKAKEYLYELYRKSNPVQRERTYWSYRFFIQSSKYNHLKYNSRLLESLIIKHNEDVREY